jgi:hypothetical protein
MQVESIACRTIDGGGGGNLIQFLIYLYAELNSRWPVIE